MESLYHEDVVGSQAAKGNGKSLKGDFVWSPPAGRGGERRQAFSNAIQLNRNFLV